MTRRQTRRTVSMTAELYERLCRHCERTGEPRAALVSRLLTEHLDAHQEPTVDRTEALANQRRRGPHTGTERVIAALHNGPCASIQQLAARAGTSVRSASDIVSRLAESGDVRTDRWGGRVAVWLPDAASGVRLW